MGARRTGGTAAAVGGATNALPHFQQRFTAPNNSSPQFEHFTAIGRSLSVASFRNQRLSHYWRRGRLRQSDTGVALTLRVRSRISQARAASRRNKAAQPLGERPPHAEREDYTFRIKAGRR